MPLDASLESSIRTNAAKSSASSAGASVNNVHSRYLKRMRAVVEGGWCQGQMFKFSPEGTLEHCLMGAYVVCRPMMDFVSATHAVKFIHKMIGDVSVAAWNDQPGRTKEEVLEMLDKAINAAEFWDSLYS